MAHRKDRKIRFGFIVIAVILPATGLAGILGTGPGPEVLIPILTEQLQAIEKGIRVANNTLGAIKGLHRGIDRLRHYRLSDFADDYIWKNNEIRGIRREWRTLQRGGSSSHTGMAKLRQTIYRISSDDPDYQSVDFEHRRFRQVNVEEDTLHVGDRLSAEEESRAQEYDIASQDVYQNAAGAESAGEAIKVNAEAQGIQIRQSADSLRLQNQQLRVSQAQLAHMSARERERLASHWVESAKLAKAFLNLEPLR